MKFNWRRFWAFAFAFLLFTCGRAAATGYTLSVNIVGSGSVLRNPTNSVYPAGATVTLTAVPTDAGWFFSGWSGDATGTNNPINMVMNADKVITATFQAQAAYHLTLATNGQGAISLSPPGGLYTSNTVVSVTATPAAGWVFDSWSGAATGDANPLSILMNADRSVTGNFGQLPAFDLQPQNITNALGGTADFTAHAVGTAPVSYQWFFNNNELANATNNTLILTNLTLASVGNYGVVAANQYGSATSFVAALVLTNAVGSSNVLSVCSEAALRAAIQKGGWVSINCNGTVILTSTINITNSVILDATGVSFTLSGGNALRLLHVSQGAMFSATNLTLANGRATNDILNGSPVDYIADGGAIYNDGGTITLASCLLTNNTAHSFSVGGLARGGALFNNGGAISLYNSSLSNNTAIGGIVTTEPAPGGVGYGGAVFSTGGSVTLVNTIVTSNLCTVAGGGNGEAFGGALFSKVSTIVISESIFAGNLAAGGDADALPYSNTIVSTPAYGGALAATSGKVMIVLSKFTGNTARGGASGEDQPNSPGLGGAVYSTADLTAKSSSFTGNQALAGDNLVHFSGFPRPVAGGYGGGLYSAGTGTLDKCTIYSNSVQGASGTNTQNGAENGGDGLGGGIFNASQLAITNCTISLNSALAGSGDPPFSVFHVPYGSGTNGAAIGGGLYNSNNATLFLMNATIASNSCVAAYGINGLQGSNGVAAGVQIANTNGTVQLKNTILAYGGTNGNAYGLITDNGFNICSDGSANFQSGASYNYTDPRLGSLGYDGGPTPCMALLSNSPAIDFGNNAGAPSTDQRGYPRPNNGVVDIGAYEFYAANQSVAAGPRLSIASTANGMRIAYTAFPSTSYHLQVSTNLTSWVDLATDGPFPAITNITRVVSAPGGNPRFFRLVQ